MERKASVKFIIKKGYDDFFTEFKFLNKKIKITNESHHFDVPFEKLREQIILLQVYLNCSMIKLQKNFLLISINV